MLARVLRELITLVRIFGEKRYRGIRPLARGTPARHRQIEVGATFPNGIVEVQHGQEEIGAVPLLARPLCCAGW